MAKDCHWFKHDYNARRDPKMIRLARVKGMKGIGIYWTLVEIMSEQEGSIGKDEISDIAFEMREDENNLLSILLEFDLFVIEPYYFSNTRVLRNLDERRGRSNNARESVAKRWAKYKSQNTENKELNTNVLPKSYEEDTIREEKRREEKSRQEGFERFWISYPKKKSKGSALKSWSKIKPDLKLQIKIQEKISKLKTSKDWTKESGKYIPYPATWLNAMGWEDETTTSTQEPIYNGIDLN